MSKIGEKPVAITDDVTAEVAESKVVVKGPHGEMTIDVPKGIKVKKEEGKVIVERVSNARKVRALHGLIRSMIQNAVVGVVKPWEKHLEVVGTGYKVKLQGKDLVFDVGYSHSVKFEEREGISYAVNKNKITVSGVDKQYVGETANMIRSIRKPDAYKGKGVRYEGEVMHLKPGKKAATTA